MSSAIASTFFWSQALLKGIGPQAERISDKTSLQSNSCAIAAGHRVNCRQDVNDGDPPDDLAVDNDRHGLALFVCGSGVSFYNQYRIWPEDHVTPCLELVTPHGKSRSYPITRNTLYDRWWPALRTDAEQTIVWIIDNPSATVRRGGVWCSINRATGDFVGARGPFPAGVTETSGFPPSN